jgi:serine/threonine-protein kinase RsbW
VKATRNVRSVELAIPSTLGYEKIAMDTAASLARKVGLGRERIEDLRTAVGEACMNAIEHGHKQNERLKVVVLMSATGSELEISVHDRGEAFVLPEGPPDIAAIVEGDVDAQARSRGWGLYLIRTLVDEVEFKPLPKGGNVVRMVISLSGEE